MIVAIAVVTLGIIFVLVKSRKRINAATTNPGSPASELPTSTEKTVVGEGDLDADGSGTLGNPFKIGNCTDGIDAEDLNMDEDDDDVNETTKPEVV
jgi:hypothetical protein